MPARSNRQTRKTVNRQPQQNDNSSTSTATITTTTTTTTTNDEEEEEDDDDTPPPAPYARPSAMLKQPESSSSLAKQLFQTKAETKELQAELARMQALIETFKANELKVAQQNEARIRILQNEITNERGISSRETVKVDELQRQLLDLTDERDTFKDLYDNASQQKKEAPPSPVRVLFVVVVVVVVNCSFICLLFLKQSTDPSPFFSSFSFLFWWHALRCRVLQPYMKLKK